MPASRRPPHFALPGEPIYCPKGHKIERDVWAMGEDPMMVRRCSSRGPRGNEPVCGTCIYWLLFPGGSRIVVEVTSAEAHHMEQERMGIREVLTFLNLRWPRPTDPNKRAIE